MDKRPPFSKSFGVSSFPLHPRPFRPPKKRFFKSIFKFSYHVLYSLWLLVQIQYPNNFDRFSFSYLYRTAFSNNENLLANDYLYLKCIQNFQHFFMFLVKSRDTSVLYTYIMTIFVDCSVVIENCGS